MQIRQRCADGITGDLRVVPLDRKGDRSGAEHTEVIRVVRVLPDVLTIEDKVLADSLPETCVKLVAEARIERCGLR